MRNTLAQFTLLDQIGAGGMGVVYRAHDSRLDREVAIKVLPAGTLSDPDARKRFRKEALSVSSLNHPGIAVVHDFSSEDGMDFLVMELVPGTTLDATLSQGPLAEGEAIRLGTQLAEALGAAHAHGVIHRDIKPGNLRVTPDGRLKVLDFGLAKTIHAKAEADTESVLATGGTAGTVPFMAPEQLRSDALDQRTDLWAVGAVLYQMVTGRRPFDAPTAAALAGEILHTPVTAPRQLRPDLSPALDRIIVKCLEKRPEDRFQDAHELAAALQNALRPAATVAAPARRRVVPAAFAAVLTVASAAALLIWRNPQRPPAEDRGLRILAVMPIENLSGDNDQQYLADGLTDALITDLARLRSLKVIARESVVQARRGGKSALEAARGLGADAFFEGSIQRANDQVRISARVVDAATQNYRWARGFDGEFKDFLRLQHQIAEAVASDLAGAATAAGTPARRQVVPAAHEAYLRGRFFWNKRTEDDLKRAIAYFEEAARADPTYAAAYSGMADAYVSLYDYGYESEADVTTNIRKAARKALELDPRSAEGHASLAHLALHDWDWTAAEDHFKQAIALDPSYVTAYHWYSLCLTAVGRTEEAVAAMRQAHNIDPLSLRINADLGMALLAAGKYDDAIEQETRTLELQPGFRVSLWIQGMAYQQKRQFADAIRKYREALAASPGNPNYLAALGNALGESGQIDDARQVLKQLNAEARKEPVSAFFFALVHTGLGEKKEALDWLERAYQERSGSIRYLKVEPRLEPLRNEERFRELMKRVGLHE